MKITAALIVRNEEDCLRACLESLEGVVDDIVIVDTGSSDGTEAIARGFTGQVYAHPWADDFAAARNVAIDYAQGDYILKIDADEQVTEPHLARGLLDAFIAKWDGTVVGTVSIRSAIWTGGHLQEGVDPVYRFFKRGAYRYQGAIHEQLVPCGGEKREAPTGLEYLHSGYSHSPDQAGKKHERNKRLLRRELDKRPEDPYLWYQLGKTHFATSDFAEAATCMERSLEGIRFEGATPTIQGGRSLAPEVLTHLLATLAYAYVNLDQIPRARELLERHREMGHSGTLAADFPHALGYTYLMLGDVAKSRELYLQSIEFGPGSELVVGTGSHASHYHLGLLHEIDRHLEEALREYISALQIKPDYATVLERVTGMITDYGVALPESVWEASDQSRFSEIYLERLTQAVRQGQSKEAELLLRSAGTLSAGLLEQCKASLTEL